MKEASTFFFSLLMKMSEGLVLSLNPSELFEFDFQSS